MTAGISNTGLQASVIADLARSDLTPEDIGARPIGAAEMTACKLNYVDGRPPQGYVIPYYNMKGESVKYYRLRLLQDIGDNIRYKGLAGEPNHLYFPRGLMALLRTQLELPPEERYIIVTEGEKKAASAVKKGIPSCAVGGVDSWKTRRILLPKDTQLSQRGSGELQAQIPRGTGHSVITEGAGALAAGMNDLFSFCVRNKFCVIIVYDTDADGEVKTDVQRAAATLGYEFRYHGLPMNRIRQIVLPASKAKVGLDDFLVKRGAREFTRLVGVTMRKRTAFPRHPNPVDYIAGRLQKKQLSRKETQDVAAAILAELEARGRRFRVEGADQLYYFDESARTLYPVQLNSQRTPLHETTFGGYVYREFNLGAADKRVIEWLATQFSGEPPIDDTETQQVLTRYRDGIAFQTGDAHYVLVTSDPDHPFQVCANGTNGILFEQGQVAEISPRELEAEFYRHLDTPRMHWLDVFNQMKVKESLDEDGNIRSDTDQMRKLIALLYYISPWLFRWRGTQLPIELVIGEAGSGKSSLLSLRQRIVTGKSYLSNMTTDIRDWYTGITARGGLHVLDNVHFGGKKKDYQQQLSDEICRVITEPDPHIEMRKLYTDNTIISLPVRSTFAVTSIEQPFYNTDLLQRSAVFELEAISRGHDSDWIPHQMQRAGGRIGWVAHHLAAIHSFLHRALWLREWDDNYPAHHRLANYEQCLMLMAKVFEMDANWIPDALVQSTEGQLTEADAVMRALREFVRRHKTEYPRDYFQKRWSVKDITQWMEQQEHYSTNDMLTNSWRLGRYMQSHKSQLEHTIKLYQAGKYANKFMYGIYQHDG